MKTILLVEDEDVLRELLREMLEYKGYRVLEARNGQDALKLCEDGSRKVNLLLTDVVMPKMSGSELADRLRATHPALKIIFMSGYTGERSSSIHKALDGRRVAFLQKPFRMQLLETKVRELLESGD